MFAAASSMKCQSQRGYVLKIGFADDRTIDERLVFFRGGREAHAHACVGYDVIQTSARMYSDKLGLLRYHGRAVTAHRKFPHVRTKYGKAVRRSYSGVSDNEGIAPVLEKLQRIADIGSTLAGRMAELLQLREAVRKAEAAAARHRAKVVLIRKRSKPRAMGSRSRRERF
jgi:hypothetical protein